MRKAALLDERGDGFVWRQFIQMQALLRRADAEIGILENRGEELLLALALCGASASEIAVVCTQDIDIDARVIQLWGESERTNPIDDWSLGVMDEAVMRIPDSTPMVVRPDLPIQRAAHTVTVRLNRLIQQAGLSSSAEFELTGVSIRLGAARKVFESEGLEAAAIFLGNQSLLLHLMVKTVPLQVQIKHGRI